MPATWTTTKPEQPAELCGRHPAKGVGFFLSRPVKLFRELDEQNCIVGIYIVRPPRARREKPRASAFTSANIDKIIALGPDLVLTFSDLQADIAADLVRCGLVVLSFNQRNVAGILDMARMLGTMVDADARADQLVATLEAGLVQARSRAECLPKRPEGILRGMGEARAPNAVGW